MMIIINNEGKGKTMSELNSEKLYKAWSLLEEAKKLIDEVQSDTESHINYKLNSISNKVDSSMSQTWDVASELESEDN